MTEPVLGIDIAKLKFNVCLIAISGKLKHKVFPNTATGFEQLNHWLSKHGSQHVHACLEATGTYSEPLALFLHEAGHTVSLINPAAIKAFAQSRLSRTKTDRVDAELIARLRPLAAATCMDPAGQRSARTTGTCAPLGVASRDACDGREPSLLRHYG